MSFSEKLKNIRKRWYLLLIVVLIIGGSAAVRIYQVQQNRALATAKIGSQVYRQVDLDLLHLENSVTAKVTPVQAKQMLPLVEKLSTTSDINTQSDLAKQVYGLLTPAQYAILMDGKNASANLSNKQNDQRGRKGQGMKEGRNTKGYDFPVGGGLGIKGYQAPKEQALGSVVIKMLNDRIAEKTVTTS